MGGASSIPPVTADRLIVTRSAAKGLRPECLSIGGGDAGEILPFGFAQDRRFAQNNTARKCVCSRHAASRQPETTKMRAEGGPSTRAGAQAVRKRRRVPSAGRGTHPTAGPEASCEGILAAGPSGPSAPRASHDEDSATFRPSEQRHRQWVERPCSTKKPCGPCSPPAVWLRHPHQYLFALQYYPGGQDIWRPPRRWT